MNDRVTSIIIFFFLVILPCLASYSLFGIWAYKTYRQRLDPTPAQVVSDSLKVYREKAAIHFDSSQFYYRKYETLTQHTDSVSTDSAALAHLVAEYSANLRRTIAAEIRDSIARQRGEIRAD